MTKLTHLQTILDAVAEPYHLLPLQGDARLLITQRGGRVLGVFPAADADNLLWTNDEALASADTLTDFIASGNWNLGGERVWIAPEIQYIIHERRDFWGTHRLPAAIDPGHYQLESGDGKVQLSQSITLTAHNIASGEKSLNIHRTIETVADPLRALSNHSALQHDVTFVGYQQTVTLTETGGAPMFSESWNLVQVKPGGQLYIATTGSVEASPYFGDVPDEVLHPNLGPHLRLDITGTRQYKVGYKAATLTGRMAYLNQGADGSHYLLVRHFDNNPSAIYSEEPPTAPGVNGHSVHVYNDGGDLGGFGEMEASGRAIGGYSGHSTATDTFRMWVYIGPRPQLERILQLLTGVTL